MKTIRILASLALIAILAGCAASQKLSDADRAKFKSATVSPQVEKGQLLLLAPGQADAATLKIAVPQYGFGVTTLLSSKVVPVIQIKLEMVDSSGRLLWTESERILPSVASPMESTTWKEMADNPAKVEDELRKAAAYVAKKIVAEL